MQSSGCTQAQRAMDHTLVMAENTSVAMSNFTGRSAFHRRICRTRPKTAILSDVFAKPDAERSTLRRGPAFLEL